jgi:predicted NBD/HSP70 family sugar kinase
MKKLLSVSLLMLCLSFPAFGGHTLGGGAACNCGTPGCVEDYPGECGSKRSVATQPIESPTDAAAEAGILLVALLFWLRLKT